MKTFVWQILILGGFYFIVSLLFSWGSGSFFEIVNMAVLVVFFALFIVLCIKRKYVFLTRFQDKFTRTANYVAAFGLTQWFGIVFVTVPGIVYGYKASKALYNGHEMPEAPVGYLETIAYVYWGILLLSLVWATYQSFRKAKQ